MTDGEQLPAPRVRRPRQKKVQEFLNKVAETTPPPVTIQEKPAEPARTLPPPAPPKRKIAVLGSAVSSVGLAPIRDLTWEIWACSPANRALPRISVWFELHNWEVKRQEGLTEWLEYLKTQPHVFVQDQLKRTEDFPGAMGYPLEYMIEKWGPWWFTSQIAYMLAMAIEQQPEAIGIYGVDMAATSEYSMQRLGCQFFIDHIVRNSKINLVVPPESDILEPTPLYGYCESSRNWRKYRARELELRNRIADLEAKERATAHEKIHLVGALDDHQYHQAHWTNRRDFY